MKGTPLQKYIDFMRCGFLSQDAKAGNGGKEVIDTFVRCLRHEPPPKEGFASVRDLLDYRYEDIAMP